MWRAPEGPEGLAAAHVDDGGEAGPDFKTTHRAPSADPAPLVWRAPEGPEGQAAAHVGGGGAWPGFEIDRSEPQARVWRSRGRAAAHGRTKQPGLTKRTQRPEHPWGLKRLRLVRLAARLAQG